MKNKDEAGPMSDETIPEGVPKRRGGGPKTPEGKQRAKANSMKHGLRAKVLLPEELVAVFEEHKAELTRQFALRSRYEAWLVRERSRGRAQTNSIRSSILFGAGLVR